MNIVYASFHSSTKQFAKVFAGTDYLPGQAVQKYNRLLSEGLSEYAKVSVVCELPITERNYSQKKFERSEDSENDVDYVYLPLVNKHRLKDLLAVCSCMKECRRLIVHDKRSSIIISDVLNAPVALGSYIISRLYSVPYVAVLTDAPEYVYKSSDKAYRLVTERLLQKTDGYVFLTEQMNRKFNIYKKKYCIVEGICNEPFNENKAPCTGKKIVMYTGTLDKKYGIRDLVEGFLEANLPDTELHIYGDGNYKDELLEVIEAHKNIKYFGTVINSEMVRRQAEASLLVNPRPAIGEFTKYSFPSKTMEYMCSGVPVLMAKLPGIPEEYYEYAYTMDDVSSETISDSLRTIFAYSDEQRADMGHRAQQFVLNNKNSKKQAAKVIEMMKSM